jgi:shikimate kinase
MTEPRRSFLLVAVGRTMGAGGSFVGRRLATRLGCRFLDRELLVEAMEVARTLEQPAEETF